jgi:hypothetical protein
MKKMQFLLAMAFAVCGSMAVSYADDAAQNTSGAAVMDLSPAEKAFAAKLSAANGPMFNTMAPADRAAVMQMADAGMAPDEAMSQVSSAGNSAASN